MRNLLLIVAVTVLSGCAAMQEARERARARELANAHVTCDAYGYPAGSSARAACVERALAQRKAEREAANKAFICSGHNTRYVGATDCGPERDLPRQQSMPRTTNCVPNGVGGFHCSTF
jgi:hypothetical protein